MIILQIQMVNITIVFFKRDSPITGYRNAPFTLTTTLKPVNTPSRWCISYKAVHVLSQDKCRQYLAYTVHQVTPYIPGIIILDQPAQSPVTDGTNDHLYSVYGITVRCARGFREQSTSNCSNRPQYP